MEDQETSWVEEVGTLEAVETLDEVRNSFALIEKTFYKIIICAKCCNLVTKMHSSEVETKHNLNIIFFG